MGGPLNLLTSGGDDSEGDRVVLDLASTVRSLDRNRKRFVNRSALNEKHQVPCWVDQHTANRDVGDSRHLRHKRCRATEDSGAILQPVRVIEPVPDLVAGREIEVLQQHVITLRWRKFRLRRGWSS